eukprot:gene17400-19143_t
MPARKYSATSDSLTGSACSSSTNGGCRRTASMHQINELYDAINDLIAPAQRSSHSASHGSSTMPDAEERTCSTVQPMTRDESLEEKKLKYRPSRSVSSVSSKRSYSSYATNRLDIRRQLVEGQPKDSGSKNVFSKVMSKMRIKRKNTTKQDEGKMPLKPMRSVDDLLDLMSSSSSQTSSNKKVNGRKFMTVGRKKAHSFDSLDESSSSVISADSVSTKLRNWHLWATSFAVNQENEAQSVDTGFSEERKLEEDDSMKKPICYEPVGDNSDTVDFVIEVLDFCAPRTDVVRDFENEAHQQQQQQHKEETKNPGIEKSKLKLTASDSERRSRKMKRLEVPGLLYRHSDIGRTNRKRDRESRGLSLRSFSDVLGGKSASCDQLNRKQGNAREISRLKVKEWLEDLNQNQQQRKDLAEGQLQSSEEDKKMNPKKEGNYLSKAKKRLSLPSLPVFYLPIQENDNKSLRKITEF